MKRAGTRNVYFFTWPYIRILRLFIVKRYSLFITLELKGIVDSSNMFTFLFLPNSHHACDDLFGRLQLCSLPNANWFHGSMHKQNNSNLSSESSHHLNWIQTRWPNPSVAVLTSSVWTREWLISGLSVWICIWLSDAFIVCMWLSHSFTLIVCVSTSVTGVGSSASVCIMTSAFSISGSGSVIMQALCVLTITVCISAVLYKTCIVWVWTAAVGTPGGSM